MDRGHIAQTGAKDELLQTGFHLARSHDVSRIKIVVVVLILLDLLGQARHRRKASGRSRHSRPASRSSNDTSRVEGVRSGLGGIGLAFGRIKGSRSVGGRVGGVGWNPSLPHHHFAHGESSGLIGADIGNGGEGLDGICVRREEIVNIRSMGQERGTEETERTHPSHESVPPGEFSRSSGKSERDDGDEGCGKDRDGSGDGVGCERHGYVSKSCRGDDDEGEEKGCAEEEVGERVEPER
jgi:hypothetical protein